MHEGPTRTERQGSLSSQRLSGKRIANTGATGYLGTVIATADNNTSTLTQSAAGSAWQMLPPIVPRFLTAR